MIEKVIERVREAPVSAALAAILALAAAGKVKPYVGEWGIVTLGVAVAVVVVAYWAFRRTGLR
jgi:hypothetical protein